MAIPILPEPAPVTSPAPYHPLPWDPTIKLPPDPAEFEWLGARLRSLYNHVKKEVNGNRYYIICEDIENLEESIESVYSKASEQLETNHIVESAPYDIPLSPHEGGDKRAQKRSKKAL